MNIQKSTPDISFYDTPTDNIPMVFVVICTRHNGKWIYVRHRERDTYEVPGGHIKPGEDAIFAAKRKLYEETGAVDFILDLVPVYAVTKDNHITGGYLFFADVKVLSSLPEYEIVSIDFFEGLPDNLTYPAIQPFLFKRVKEWLKERERN
jgi:8-oxo-dGTP diphosphatase